MVWIILIVISIVISGAVLALMGGGGGLLLLLALNGFSEAESNPIIGCYALFVLALALIPSTLIDWWVVRRWFPQTSLPFWGVVGLNILVIVGLIAAVIGFIMIRRALS